MPLPMRTSLNEIKEIEGYLLQTAPVEDRLLLEVKMTLEPTLAEKVDLQKKVYHQVRQYAHKQLREEIRSVEADLFKLSKYRLFRQKVLRLFKP